MIYETNIDLVNDNVYTKFGLNRSIRFQDIEQKLNSDVNQAAYAFLQTSVKQATENHNKTTALERSVMIYWEA